MNDIRPYLLRAHIDWLDDNEQLPHILIHNVPETQLPQSLSQQEYVVVNVSSDAVRNLAINGDEISFDARFNGTVFHVTVPFYAALVLSSKDGTIKIPLASPHEYEQLPPETKTKPKMKLVQGGATPSSSRKKTSFHLVKKEPRQEDTPHN